MVAREYPIASVEAGSPMTPQYRRRLLRVLANQAYGEQFAAHLYLPWVRRAPGPDEQLRIAEVVHEEMEHWHRIVSLMRELGVAHEEILEWRGKHMFVPIARLCFPRLSWLDIVLSTFLVDSAAYIMIEDNASSSYAPLARVTQAILAEEQGHGDSGRDFLKRQLDKYGRAPVQRKLNKWWRVALNMFGRPHSTHGDLCIRLGLKIRTNEERRAVFRRDMEPRIEALGLAVPTLYRTHWPFL